MKTLFSITAFLGLILFLSGCSDDFLLQRREDRLIGAWEFDRVLYFPNRGSRRNLSREYAGDVIEFFRNGRAIYYDASLNASFDGDWILDLDRSWGESDDAEFFLDMYFYDFIHREEFSFLTQATILNNNRMTLISNERAGSYEFRLRKLN
jgi:hypothetical protein